MTKEYAASIEEVFVENNFELGEDAYTITQNFNIASILYDENLEQTNNLVEDVVDGMVVDTPSAVFAIQNLVFSKKYKDQFQNEMQNIKE